MKHLTSSLLLIILKIQNSIKSQIKKWGMRQLKHTFETGRLPIPGTLGKNYGSLKTKVFQTMLGGDDKLNYKTNFFYFCHVV